MGSKATTTSHIAFRKTDLLFSEKTMPFKLLNDRISDSFLLKMLNAELWKKIKKICTLP
jgi:hypothetical protein